MYITYNNKDYPCKCRVGQTMVYSGLPDDFPEEISGEIVLKADNGFVLRTDRAEDYLRQTFENGILTLTNTPEPEPTIETENEIEVEPTAQDDVDAMLVDHEYRLTLLELGVNE